MEEDLESYKILVEEYDKYLIHVRSALINAHKDAIGTRHEVATQTAANLINDLYKRWFEALTSVQGGEKYTFPAPSEIGVEKEEAADEGEEEPVESSEE